MATLDTPEKVDILIVATGPHGTSVHRAEGVEETVERESLPPVGFLDAPRFAPKKITWTATGVSTLFDKDTIDTVSVVMSPGTQAAVAAQGLLGTYAKRIKELKEELDRARLDARAGAEAKRDAFIAGYTKARPHAAAPAETPYDPMCSFWDRGDDWDDD